jgi:hypothetical protein
VWLTKLGGWHTKKRCAQLSGDVAQVGGFMAQLYRGCGLAKWSVAVSVDVAQPS